ncbi:cathepsin L-like proteinase isoform X2 [Plodia interpunctella]|uniref:cathepsin L-like proteinase isoform X2 n=1 Tax=Plodia interpunctella TaxID=58824 RepID=UPI002368F0C7|nr:cathepsin L-like proteinase isoform X2 [Plodia interpunctella]
MAFIRGISIVLLVCSVSYTYVLLGSYDFNGRVIHEWKRTMEEDGEYRLEDTLLVYRTEYGVDVPVQFDQKKYGMEEGRLQQHSVTEFYDYKPSVSNDDLEIEDEDECEIVGTDFRSNLKFLHPAISLDVDIAFDGYRNHHNKKYKTKEIELRKAIFHKNWRLVVDHNRKNLGYTLAMNQYADRTDEELQYLTGTRPSRPDSKATHTFHSMEVVDELADQLPEEFDLRLKGVMRPIKQQGDCGSCWAFSSTAAVEGAISYDLGGRDVDLSEQSLVDCAWGYDNFGCMGGSLNDVFRYILDHGIPADVDYGQYKAENGKCHVQNLTSIFKIRGFGKVNRNSINSMKLALNKYGPVTVSVMASPNMKLYSSGIFYDDYCEGGYVNHGVVVVGYGVRDGDLYWVVRNSWGEDWGESGHILMSAQQNNCFLLDDPYYVIV